MNLSQKVALNTVLLTVSRLVVAGSGLAGVILSTRYFGVGRFGELTTAVAFVMLFGPLTDVGVWTVTAREIARHPEDEQRLLGNVFTLGLVLSVLAIAVAVGVMALVYGGADRHLVRVAILILATQMVLTAPGGTTTAYMTAHQRALPAAAGAVAASIAFVVAIVVVVSANLGFEAVAACYALTGVLNGIVQIAFALRSTSLRPRYDYELVLQLARWALPQGAVLGVSVLYFRIDTVLLSLLGSNRDVALYGLSYRVIEFLTLVPNYAMTTLFPEIARCDLHSPRLRMLMQGALSGIVLAVVPILLLFIGFAPEVVKVIGGSSFGAAAGVLRIMVVALVASFVSAAFLQALVALNQQGRLVAILSVVLATNVALNAVLIPRLHATGAALALLSSEMALALLGRRLFARVGSTPSVQRPLRLAGATLAGACVVMALRAVVGSGADPILVLAVGGTLTLVAFGAAAHVLRAVPIEVTSAVAQMRGRSR